VAVFQDRLEITSSGSLHFGLTAEKLFEPHESLPWNPLIARVFHRRGLIESWGRGTLKIAELAAKAGLPRPEIEEGGGCVVTRFRAGTAGRSGPDLGDLPVRQRRILQALAGNRRMATRQLAAELGVDTRPIRRDLSTLKGLGLVENAGRGAGSVWFSVTS
jgi:ATP-dependent DNA helicase RecG